ncbi:MAG: 50S ribosomal protein L11 methyltransferase [Lautropia sp.]|nr:50S ribosomal protein L11 methyltransferase [Lautropia sp.]
MSQSWTELSIEVDKAQAEAWADACLEAGALSVQAEDADADSADEQPLFGEPLPAGTIGAGMLPQAFGWKRTRLALLVDRDDDAPAILAAAAAQMEQPAPPVLASRRIDDQDWVRLTQSQFDPIPVGRRLLILPSWHAAEAQAGDREALIIDPGLAFGTGSHPTTRLCLEWLDEHDLAGLRVIDYGCGSGILAIAAARLGAREVIGIDIDPQAVLSTQDNARINRVSITALSGEAGQPAPADLVVANILSTPLKLLAPLLSSLVAPGGRLVLSGVLERQIDEVSACYDPALHLSAWRCRDGWACLAGHRPA